MLQVVLFSLSVLFASVSGWGACRVVGAEISLGSKTFRMQTGGNCSGNYPYSNQASVSSFCSSIECPSVVFRNGRYYAGLSPLGGASCRGSAFTCNPAQLSFGSSCYQTNDYECGSTRCEAKRECDTQAEADSVKCEFNPSLPECQQAKDTTLTICLTQKNSLGGYVSNIHRCSCKANNGEVYQCNGKSNVDINNDCPIVRTIQGTCSENGYPNGEPTDSSGTSAECYAVTGSTCHMRDRATGNTFRCECDGSCDFAQRKLASGECANPYPPPQTGNDSLDLPLPEQPPQSSGSEQPPQSSGATCDNCSALQAIQANTQDIMESNRSIEGYAQTTMDNTTDIKNGLTEMAIDVSHIRTATENTDLTTQGIDSKLSNTNSLLNDIKNKNWNPQINLNPNITVVDSVKVNVDTSRAPSEILQQMRESNYSESDTLGMGGNEESLRLSVDSTIYSYRAESFARYGDSLGGAVSGVKNAIGAYRDSLAHGAMSDSVAKWGNQLVNNGVLVGDGSSSCPSVFTRNFTWNMGRFGNISIGSFGTFLCADFGLGVTLWALARMILRAMVAISCMLWLYRAVIGVDGGSSDEED